MFKKTVDKLGWDIFCLLQINKTNSHKSTKHLPRGYHKKLITLNIVLTGLSLWVWRINQFHSFQVSWTRKHIIHAVKTYSAKCKLDKNKRFNDKLIPFDEHEGSVFLKDKDPKNIRNIQKGQDK